MPKQLPCQTKRVGMVILSATHLAVRYRNGALGVADASFSVDAGEIVALFGANGAGKTTSVRAVTGFLRSEGARVEHGAVTLFGRDMTNAEPHKISGLGVAFVPERSKIFPHLSVADNLVSVGRVLPAADGSAAPRAEPALPPRSRTGP